MIRPTEAQRLAERTRPKGAPVMRQRWAHLLFLHWEWDPAAIQATLPPGLTVDVFAGRAWVGVVPFFMERVRPRGLPAIPGLSDFLELNVRTYVHDAQGRPGVWFYSLDCNRWLAVKLARTFFHLPYQHASMKAAVEAGSGEVEYWMQRRGAPAETEGCFCWKPTRPVESAAGPGLAQPGSLEFFLVERYRLFAQDARRGQLFTGRVHHVPYRIAAAETPEWNHTILGLAGFDCEGRAPGHVCAAPAVDVEVWPLEPVAAGARIDDEAGEVLGPEVVPA